MRALLIQPAPPRTHWPKGIFVSRYVPTGLAYAAAALQREGHEVRVLVREEQLIKTGFDWTRAELELRNLLADFKPHLVGFSLLTPYVPEACRIGRLVRELCGASTLIVAGGVHATALPERTLQECPDTDVVVCGEGERTLAELADKGACEAVRGIVFRGEEAYVRTAPRAPAADLDALGPPAYALFDMAHYTAPSRWMVRWLELPALNVRTSRGCPNRCWFCAGSLVSGLGVRHHSTDYVVDQVAYGADTLGVKAVHFEDDTLGADRERLIGLCEALCRKGLHRRVVWDGCLRVDQPDPELLRLMKAAGCIQVEYGFESGSEAGLRSIGKRATVEANLRAVRLTREAGLRVFADIMVGLPGETEQDFKATMDFIRRVNPDVTSFGRLFPLPGTPLYERVPQARRDSLDWAAYTYEQEGPLPFNFTAMPEHRFEKRYRKHLRRFIRPKMTLELLRDTDARDENTRRALARRFRSFALRHPICTARIPRPASMPISESLFGRTQPEVPPPECGEPTRYAWCASNSRQTPQNSAHPTQEARLVRIREPMSDPTVALQGVPSRTRPGIPRIGLGEDSGPRWRFDASRSHD
jgi:radical SAM superfamily enzyme YgiQ (UPF0313 family)